MHSRWNRVLICILIFCSACQSTGSAPDDVSNNKLWTSGKQSYQILKQATDGDDFKRLSSKEEAALIDFLRQYESEASRSSRTEQNILYYVERGYEEYKIAVNSSAPSMDRINSKMAARQALKELRTIYEGTQK